MPTRSLLMFFSEPPWLTAGCTGAVPSPRSVCLAPRSEHLPRPLLLPSLGTCAGYYATHYLRRKGLASEGTHVRVTAGKASGPAPLENFNIDLRLPILVDRALTPSGSASVCIVRHHPPSESFAPAASISVMEIFQQLRHPSTYARGESGARFLSSFDPPCIRSTIIANR